MTSALSQLQDLTATVPQVPEQQLRFALSRFALEVNTRLQYGSIASAEYMSSVIKSLRAIGNDSNAELRINCLLDVAQYFYVVGQSFSAIEPASDAVAVASGSGNKPLLRKGLTFLGIIYADTGNTS